VARLILPLILLPLDKFGEEIASRYEETISLSEPALIQKGWVRVLQPWDPSQWPEVMKTIGLALTLSDELGDDIYTYATQDYQSAIVVLLGSVSQDFNSVLMGFKSFWDHLSKEPFHKQQVKLLPLLDISSIPGEEKVPYPERLKDLAKAVEDISWNDYVYLLDNYSESNLRCNERDEIAQAIQVFLEGLTMGDVWDDYANIWLNVSPGNETRFASFSVFSLKSPQSDLLPYLSQVGFCELWDSAAGNPELQVGKGAEGTLEIPNRALISKSQALEEPPDLTLISPPGILEPKTSYIKRFIGMKDIFITKFSVWQETIRQELLGFKFEYLEALEGQLNEFRERIKDSITAGLKEKNFIQELNFRIDHFRTLALQEKREHNHVPQGNTLGVKDPDKALERVYQSVGKAVKKLPNMSSLTLHIIFIAGVQYLITRYMLRLLPWSFLENKTWLWGIFIFLLVLFAYLAWRLPSWRVGYLIRTKIKNAHTALIAQAEQTYQDLLEILKVHWGNKRDLAFQSELRVTADEMEKCALFLSNRAEEKITQYPYPDVDWSMIQSGGSTFQRSLEPPSRLDRLVEDIYKEPDEFLAGIKTISPELSIMLMAGKVRWVEKLILNSIRSHYSKIQYDIVEDITPRLKKAATNYDALRDMPLINVSSSTVGLRSASRIYCIANPGWRPHLDSAFEDWMQETITLDMKTKDRIYFYQVFYDFTLNDLLEYFN